MNLEPIFKWLSFDVDVETNTLSGNRHLATAEEEEEEGILPADA